MLVQCMESELTAESVRDERAWQREGRCAVSRCSYDGGVRSLPLSAKVGELRRAMEVRLVDAPPAHAEEAYR